jgi:hypothetical protein
MLIPYEAVSCNFELAYKQNDFVSLAGENQKIGVGTEEGGLKAQRARVIAALLARRPSWRMMRG